MTYRLLADVVVLAHFAFVLFVVLGGLLVRWWPRAAWLHLPAAVWGVGIALLGGTCPLTPLENRLRMRAGGAGYPGGFLEHYVLPVLYPQELTRGTQVALGAIALALNLALYGWALARRRRGGS